MRALGLARTHRAACEIVCCPHVENASVDILEDMVLHQHSSHSRLRNIMLSISVYI